MKNQDQPKKKLKIKFRTSYATYSLISINIFFFVLELKLGGSENIETLYSLGALVPNAVLHGQWWRLLTANFLHYGWGHLLTNMLGLFFLGRLVEWKLGVFRYLSAYFISGIGSMFLFTYLVTQWQESGQILVGASGAIMGLIGVILASLLRQWLKDKSHFSFLRLQSALVIVILQFAFDFMIPQVSWLTHLLGLMIGFILGLFF